MNPPEGREESFMCNRPQVHRINDSRNCPTPFSESQRDKVRRGYGIGIIIL
jgi:hypothetical protein